MTGNGNSRGGLISINIVTSLQVSILRSAQMSLMFQVCNYGQRLSRLGLNASLAQAWLKLDLKLIFFFFFFFFINPFIDSTVICV